MKKLALIITVFLFSSLFTYAGDDALAQMRAELRENAREVVKTYMALPPDQEVKFFAIYGDLDLEMKALNDTRINNITEYSKIYQNVDEKLAEKIMKANYTFVDKRESINKKYSKRISKELSPTVALKFLHLQRFVQSLVDSELYYELPIFKPSAEKK
jgi:tRNA nucleotidyltransferase/poly(A) polymerase